jgi:hypothetical protein
MKKQDRCRDPLVFSPALSAIVREMQAIVENDQELAGAAGKLWKFNKFLRFKN